MTQQAINNAKALYALQTEDTAQDRKILEELLQLIRTVPPLKEVLRSPVISLEKKHRMIDQIAEKGGYPDRIRSFLKRLCDCNETEEFADIVKAYEKLWNEKHRILPVELLFAKEPSEEETGKALQFLKETYPGWKLEPQVVVDSSLIGGSCIRVDNKEYDRSYEGRLRELERKLTGR